MLARVTDIINNEPDVRGAVAAIAREVAEYFGTDMASVYLYNEDGGLEQGYTVGLSAHFARELERLARTEWAPRYLAGSNGPVVMSTKPRGAYPSPIHKLASSEQIGQLVSVPLVYCDHLMGIMLIYHRAERAYLESELSLLHTVGNILALAIANTRLAEARKWERRAQDQFLDALSHELRTPLTSIMGFTQMIRKRFSHDRDVDTRLRDQLDVLWAQAQRLNRLMDTFVDITNLERGEFTVDHGYLDVTALLQSAVEQARAQMRSRHQIALNMPDHPVWIHGDARRLEHVFSHIVSNALRYSPVDATISVSCEDREARGEIAISIVDRGPGISGDLQRQIFKRFYPSETRKAGGMGMGLYVSRAIMEAHGGHLTLESTPGHGTTVSIILPK